MRFLSVQIIILSQSCGVRTVPFSVGRFTFSFFHECGGQGTASLGVGSLLSPWWLLLFCFEVGSQNVRLPTQGICLAF